MATQKASPGKVCFVTSGATAPFTALIESVLKPSSLDTLIEEGYDHLLIQHGTARKVFVDCANAAKDYLEQGQKEQKLTIDGFDFDHDALRPQFESVQHSQGVIISHAGSRPLFAQKISKKKKKG